MSTGTTLELLALHAVFIFALQQVIRIRALVSRIFLNTFSQITRVIVINRSTEKFYIDWLILYGILLSVFMHISFKLLWNNPSEQMSLKALYLKISGVIFLYMLNFIYRSWCFTACLWWK